MGAPTLTEVNAILDALKSAYLALATTPVLSVSVSGQSWTKHDLASLRNEIKHWSDLAEVLGGMTGGMIALGSLDEPA
jgi:hypothetical protein